MSGMFVIVFMCTLDAVMQSVAHVQITMHTETLSSRTQQHSSCLQQWRSLAYRIQKVTLHLTSVMVWTHLSLKATHHRLSVRFSLGMYYVLLFYFILVF